MSQRNRDSSAHSEGSSPLYTIDASCLLGASRGLVYAISRAISATRGCRPRGRMSFATPRQSYGGRQARASSPSDHFLGHSSLGITTTYAVRLQGERAGSWPRVAEDIGLRLAPICQLRRVPYFGCFTSLR